MVAIITLLLAHPNPYETLFSITSSNYFSLFLVLLGLLGLGFFFSSSFGAKNNGT